MLTRSLELLIAEKLTETNIVTHLKDAVQHMTDKKYSSTVYRKHDAQSYYIITVVFSDQVIVVYSIDCVDESVKIISQTGIIH